MSRFKKIDYSKKKLSKLIVYPKRDCNKYSRGVCNVIAGSKKYPGAAILASIAAQRSGAGYTRLFTVKDNVLETACLNPSLVCHSFEDLHIKQAHDSDKPESYVVGPGFDADDPGIYNLILKVLKNSSYPVLIDGGAFASFKHKSVRDAITKRKQNNFETILTPHAGEAYSIAEFYGIDYSGNQIKDAKNLTNKTNATIVLKGPNTVVCDDECVSVINNGTAALAKAGSGDVLAGIIGGLLSQGQNSIFDNCVLGVNIHCQTGIIAAKNLNDISVVPQDLIDCLPDAFNTF